MLNGPDLSAETPRGVSCLKRRPPHVRRLSLAMVALLGVIMSWEMKSAWEVMAGVTGGAILALTLYVEFISPIVRKRKLKAPCKTYFHICPLNTGKLDYV